MIKTIQNLCTFLAETAVTVQSVSAHLGELITDQGGNLPLIVQPSDPAFVTAEIVRQFDTQNPAHVELKVADTATLSVADLTKAFGAYRQVPQMRPSKPTRIQFAVDIPGKSHTCTLIANMAPDTKEMAQGNVSSLIIRRDERL
ncbi:MAG: hypothetical protein R6X34_03890 [Chloroflexota bacterium]